ncbi:serine protease grass-like [Drosophila innubila]|uniref:serine protease grass-like n=1 Tax=Drosophila innubila TaxID=198719 RepID=UPI00148E223C|nr:serine protease grass-like [Drosophila innubila]
MYRIILLILTLSLGSALTIIPIEKNADEICIRNDGKTGYCVHLRNCSAISNMIARQSQGISLSSDEITYIRNSKCPVHEKGYVCCEGKDKVLQGIQELPSQDCGKFEVDKVVGGKEIKIMSRPWMALLKFRRDDGKEGFTCGGTLIHKRYVLSAAHCFFGQQLLSVRLGEHNILLPMYCQFTKGQVVCAPQAQDFEVDRVYVHEQYSQESRHNDIALVKLKSDAEFIPNIKPICLPVNETLQQNVETMPRFLVTGWGYTETTNGSLVPLETVVTAKNRTICQESYERKIVPTQICAGDPGKDSCNGDSGGPLQFVDIYNGQQRFVQFGIVSYGSGHCGDGTPGVYANVGSYIPWIAYKIATK